MGIFKDILKPEETLGGFNPGEPDDDVFKLESLPAYPGVLPKFDEPVGSSEIDVSEITSSEYEEEVEESDAPTIPQGVDDNIYDAPDEGSVWDIFENPATGEPGTTPVEAPEPTTIEPDYSIPDEVDYGAPSYDPNQKPLFADDTDFDLTPSIQEAPKSASADDGLKMDADLIALLQGDLSSGSTKKASKQATPEPIPAPAPNEFVPVEEQNQTVFIDFSNLNETVTAPPTTAPPKVTATITDPSANPVPEPKMTAKQAFKLQAKLEKERKKEEKKANKKPFAWSAFWSSVAIFAMLSMFGEGGYYFWNKYIINKPHATEEVAKADEHKAEPKEEAKAEEHADTAKNEEAKPDSSLTAENKEEHAEPAKETAKEEHKEEPKKVAEKEISHKPVEKPKHEEKKIVEKREKKIEIKDKPESHKATKPVEKKIAKIDAKPAKPAKETATVKSTGSEVYAIQVYASPSKKDAQAWIKSLEKKGIKTGFLSPQKIRDQVWYRVRFGNYVSKEEARAAALRYGYAQSWIDRIK